MIFSHKPELNNLNRLVNIQIICQYNIIYDKVCTIKQKTNINCSLNNTEEILILIERLIQKEKR